MNIKKISEFFFVCILLVVVSACSNTYHIPIYDNIPQQVKSTDVTVGLNQEELVVEYVKADSSATSSQFGLLGALIGSMIDAGINSSSSEDAEKLAKPFKDATIDINFSKEFVIALNKKLKTVTWLRANNAQVQNSYDPNSTIELVNKSTSSAVLLVSTKYSIAPDLNSLNINSNLTLYPKDPRLTKIAETNRPDDEVKMLYRNIIKYTFKLPGKIKDKDAATKAWLKSNAKVLKSALRNGMKKIAEMIAFDLSKPVSKDKKPVIDENGKQIEIIIASGKNYKITRLVNGKLVSTNY